MNSIPVLTKELTLRIERHVGPSGPHIVSFGNARARKNRAPWPPSAVYSFGHDDLHRLPEILEFFGEIRPLFYLSHGGFSSKVAEALDRAGYRMSEWQQTVLYGVPAPAAPELSPAITIEPVTKENASEAAEVAAEGNGWAAEWRESAKQGFRESVGQDRFKMYLARVSGEAAGVADLSWTADRCCNLGGAAVLPRFRGKGVHGALIATRLHEAAKLGCELVVGGADFGSASFRNQQRYGMRLAYVEATWVRRSS